MSRYRSDGMRLVRNGHRMMSGSCTAAAWIMPAGDRAMCTTTWWPWASRRSMARWHMELNASQRNRNRYRCLPGIAHPRWTNGGLLPRQARERRLEQCGSQARASRTTFRPYFWSRVWRLWASRANRELLPNRRSRRASDTL